MFITSVALVDGSVTDRHGEGSDLCDTAPTHIVAAVTRLSAGNCGSGLTGAAMACGDIGVPAGHRHAVITLHARTQNRMVAAVTPAVTAECSDGHHLARETNCSRTRRFLRMSQAQLHLRLADDEEARPTWPGFLSYITSAVFGPGL